MASAAREFVVRVRYPPGEETRAELVARLFKGAPGVRVELVRDGVEEVIVEGPTFATTDPTRATVLLRRYLASLQSKRGDGKD